MEVLCECSAVELRLEFSWEGLRGKLSQRQRAALQRLATMRELLETREWRLVPLQEFRQMLKLMGAS